MRIVGVDIGIKHLALAEIERDAFDSPIRIHTLRLIDLTEYTHTVVPTKHCTLHHTPDLADRLEHFAQEHGAVLDQCDAVAIERQPICGLQCVQAFLFGRWRSKAMMISPNALHVAVFGKKSGLDYEQRKEKVERRAAETTYTGVLAVI